MEKSSVTFAGGMFGLLHFAKLKGGALSQVLEYIFHLVAQVENNFPLAEGKQQLVWNFFEHPTGDHLVGKVQLAESGFLVNGCQVQGNPVSVKTLKKSFEGFYVNETGGQLSFDPTSLTAEDMSEKIVTHLLKTK